MSQDATMANSSPERGSVDRADHRLGALPDGMITLARGTLVAAAPALRPCLARPRLDVDARTEHLPLAGQHDSPHVVAV